MDLERHTPWGHSHVQRYAAGGARGKPKKLRRQHEGHTRYSTLMRDTATAPPLRRLNGRAVESMCTSSARPDMIPVVVQCKGNLMYLIVSTFARPIRVCELHSPRSLRTEATLAIIIIIVIFINPSQDSSTSHQSFSKVSVKDARQISLLERCCPRELVGEHPVSETHSVDSGLFLPERCQSNFSYPSFPASFITFTMHT